MTNLISGKEALIALANGEEVETKTKNEITWSSIGFFAVNIFNDANWEFRLKPHTITINGIEVPAPFEPNKDDDCRIYVIDTRNICGWDWQHSSHYKSGCIVWRTEDEIKQVVAALRQIFGDAQ